MYTVNNGFINYKIKEARTNFSYLIKTVGKNTGAYVIRDRDEPKAVLIDIKTAEKYLPEEYLAQTSHKELPKLIKEIEKRQPKVKKLENISGSVDKILYGK